jgi:hypothetical protein
VIKILGIGVAAAAALLLAGCSDEEPNDVNDDRPPAVTATPTASPNSTNAFAPIDGAAVLETDFVVEYRDRYPQLAEGRNDQGIANDGSRACRYLVEYSENTGDRDLVLNRMSRAVAWNNITPSEDTVLDMLRLAVDQVCPDRRAVLDTFTAGG